MMPRTVERLDPGLALRSGAFDPAAVLVLWYLRKSFYPLLWLGLIAATIAGRADGIVAVGGVSAHLSSFDSVGEIIRALLSPLAIVIFAIGLRFLVAGLAFVLAYPLTTWGQAADYGDGYQGRIRLGGTAGS